MAPDIEALRFTSPLPASDGSGYNISRSHDSSQSTPLTHWEPMAPPKSPHAEPSVQGAYGYGNKLHASVGPHLEHSWPSSISQRIETIVFEQPTADAIRESSGETMTYQEMMTQVNNIGSALLDVGVKSGAMIAVLCEPTADFICALLAILRLGAVYVPLDNLQPIARLGIIAQDCQPEVIICQKSTVSQVPALGVSAHVINTSTVSSSSREVPVDTAYDGVAFILYSSGTTGTPKGIMLSQENALNQLAGWDSIFHHSKERILQQAAIGFDVSLFQVLYALTYGGVVILANKDIRGQPLKLAELMLREEVTYTVAVCSEYVALLRYGSQVLKNCKSWRYAFSGGERLTGSLKSQFRSLGLMELLLVNMYGPTEVAYCSAYGIVPYHDEDIWDNKNGSRVGGTFPNYWHYICDEHMQPLPPSIPGEICVVGVGVGLGYLNPAQSAKKFLKDKFASEDHRAKGWDSLYRSGDKGQLLEDGTLMFLGRMEGDSQAKINGVRVDLEDVGSTILQAAKGVLCEVVVMVRGVIEPFMVAFAVFQDHTPLDEAVRYLKDVLTSLPIPLNMRPAVIVPLDSMPTNVNGKVDKKALAETSLPQYSTQQSDERLTVPETQLKKLWLTILPEAHIGFQIDKDADFFQVGGNSILLVKLQALVSEVFGAYIPLVQLFQSSTLEDMAAQILEKSAEPARFKKIDWTQEIEDALDQLVPDHVVLLVGADNFIGQSMVQTLVNNDRVSEIHCLATSKSDLAMSSATPIQSAKIFKHSGELSQPFLGLSASGASILVEKATLIIHNGADFSFLKSYQTLRKPNFVSTIEVLKFALSRKTPIHYISTAGVGRLVPKYDGSLAETSLASYEPPSDGNEGYVASRWASERLLESAARKYGLPVSIHRVTGVVSPNAPSTDLLNSLLKYSNMLKTVPDFVGWEGCFDYQPLESVTKAISEKALCGTLDAGGADSVSFTHHGNSTRVPAQDLGKHLEQETGCKFAKMPLQEWVLEASRLGMDHMVASYLASPRGAKGEAIVL